MKRQQIVNIISKRSLEAMRVIKIKSRPPEKSNTILMTSVGGYNWYCERPAYFWTKFDMGFIQKGAYSEQKSLYPKIKEPLKVYDNRGLQWLRYEMSSAGLIKYFLENPSLYLALMIQRTHEMEFIIKTLKKIKSTLAQVRYFKSNLLTFVDLWGKLFSKEAMVYITFDELAWRFRNFLLHYLPKEIVNSYFPQFLNAEITKYALRKKYVFERGAVEYSKTRGVLYGMNLKARAFYVLPKFFHDIPEDNFILSGLYEKRISQDKIREFISYRLIVPIAFQISEESQYIETTALSAHFGILMRAISKRLKRPIEEFYKMSVNEIIKLL